ncbi:hypothetical protein D9V37_04260 [Nocardioides mangrovicus]|uniref:Uncharacterized protein n=1 Tax=Nocardioides mangrovicus TaxID=2478913 RepID=A0A3L8P7D8_9ACTN|nr:hypothetical protein [Nocardioides mangrovicus]RLV51135.1 hypothetical protein D9V37_04260 [Nocardioides mangrovicus]
MSTALRRLAVAGLVLGVLGVVVPLLFGDLFQSWDRFGSVEIPGHGSVRLPAGAVDVSFRGISADGGGGGSVAVPRFSASIERSGTADPVFHKVDGGAVSVNNVVHVPVWRVAVRRAGTYEVTTSGEDRGYVAIYLDLGHRRHYGRLQLGAGVLLVASLLALLVARGRRRTADQ